jgi:hypothetical protein
MLLAIDELDWPGVRRAFADRVRVDYESLSGAAPAEVEADALIESWRGLLPGFDATQHITGPVVVDDTGPDEALARTSVRGYHWIAGEEWMVAGRYTMTLRRVIDLPLRASGSASVHGSDETRRRFGEVAESVGVRGDWRIISITLTVARQTGVLSLPDTARERAQSAPRVRAAS